ncbi:hypothetical protein [uncultured Pseudokineococcus sp.]|uniref:hypothetical protein n=1 Tax=uncultured Pseudokineococcus sp. TaxID=1642928 RepID=UPI0026115513|nr:hypothetical protein [uncultured Pseudokineococcus sp.]
MSRRSAGAALLAAALLLLGAAPASASGTREQRDFLRVESTVNPQALSRMYPGSRVNWRIAADIAGAPEGDLTLRIVSSGAMVDHDKGLVAVLRSCAVPWQGVDEQVHSLSDPLPTCASDKRVLLDPTPSGTSPPSS